MRNNTIIQATDFFKAYTSNSKDILILLTAELTIIAVNSITLNFFNSQLNNFVGKKFTDFLRQHKFYLPIFDNNGNLADNIWGKELKQSLQRKEKKQTFSWFINKHQINTATYILIRGSEITAQLNAEYNKTILDNIVSNLPVSLYWKDRAGTYIGCNDYVVRMAGLDDINDIIGKSDKELPWKKDAKKIKKVDQKVIQTGKQIQMEETGVLADGSRIFLLSSKIPIKKENGEIIGIMGISFDITDRKKMETALIEAKNKAEENNTLKDKFIENMEHDLRTPASGIQQMLSLLEDTENEPIRKRQLSLAADAAKQLLKLLNNILDFSRIEHGQQKLTFSTFKLKQLVEDIIKTETPFIKKQNLQLNLNYEETIPQWLISDKLRISRILLNLIGNAIKFTNQGTVTIQVKKDRWIDDNNLYLKLIVKDTGIGIPKDKQEIIYERFARLTESDRDQLDGYGLGLSIVRQFINELKGKIKLISERNKGTTFICTIPFEVSTQLPKQENDTILETTPAIPLISNINILLVEDSKLIRIATTLLLTDNFTCHVDNAATGEEAVTLASKKRYDLILMDLGLPDMDGYKVAQTIRGSDSQPDKPVPIIALSVHNASSIRIKIAKCGMNDFLVKPLNLNKLNAIFKKWCV